MNYKQALSIVSAVSALVTLGATLLAIWTPVGDLQSRLVGTASVMMVVSLLTGLGSLP